MLAGPDLYSIAFNIHTIVVITLSTPGELSIFSKAKLRQSVSIQDSPNSSINNGKMMLSLQRSDTIDNKSNNKMDANVETLVAELNENKKSNKELKLVNFYKLFSIQNNN